MINVSDVYFLPEYGKLYEGIDQGTFGNFTYKDELGQVSNSFIKREIETEIDGTRYYDITTPYGYGGPLLSNYDDGSKGKLVKRYEAAFAEYCNENKIVSEFLRFHPILENHKDFDEVYETSYTRKTVGTNLRDYDEPFQSEFSKSCRKTVRRSLNSGVEFIIKKNPNNLETFKEIYYSTMDKNEASDYFYFDDEYFNMILETLGKYIVVTEAIYQDKVIASGLYFIYDRFIHAHLSGTLTEYLHLSPAYVLKYGTVKWGKENGYHLIHYGGGTTNSESDSLLMFKKKFTQETLFDFHIGSKVWNQDIYDKLVELSGNEGYDFFPQYRARK